MGEVSDNVLTLLQRLEEGMVRTGRGDAIDAILAAEPRKTGVNSLRDHEVVEQFRQELTDGLIRVDTANRLLGLIRTAVEAMLA